MALREGLSWVVFVILNLALPNILLTKKTVVDEVKPSVVAVRAYADDSVHNGTGFLVRNRCIVTCRHVIEGTDSAEVIINSDTYKVSEVLGDDEAGDLIILGLKRVPLAIPPLSIRESPLILGEEVLVVGKPPGLSLGLGRGYVSFVKYIPRFGNVIRVTAAFDKGWSGSPVVDRDGLIIGVATFTAERPQKRYYISPCGRLERLIKSMSGRKEPTNYGDWKVSLDSSAYDLYKKGDKLFKSADWEGALKNLKKAVDKCPMLVETYPMIGDCNFNLECYKEAIRAYEKAVSYELISADLYLNLGCAYENENVSAKAIECYKKSIKLDSSLTRAYYNLGLLCVEEMLWYEAIVALKHLIYEDDPAYVNFHYYLGVAYANADSLDKAETEFRQMIRINPTHAEAHYMLGVLYYKDKRFGDAINVLEEAISLKEDYEEACFFLGLAYLEVEDWEGARYVCKELKRMSGEDDNLARRICDSIPSKPRNCLFGL